jgi:hypothetical protein
MIMEDEANLCKLSVTVSIENAIKALTNRYNCDNLTLRNVRRVPYNRQSSGGLIVGMLRVLNDTGDSAVTWKPGNKVETEAAEIAFKAFQREGSLAFEQKDGRDVQVKEFNPDATDIIIVRPISGG